MHANSMEFTFTISLPTPASHAQGLCGDVNVYFNSQDRDDFELSGEYDVGELEVMVAEPASRRKGIAKEACQLMMVYGESWTFVHALVFTSSDQMCIGIRYSS